MKTITTFDPLGERYQFDAPCAYAHLFVDDDDDPMPNRTEQERLCERDQGGDPALLEREHRETPTLHLKYVARQNAWIEGLRDLHGNEFDHGPIEVIDGEIEPRGALDDVTPRGAHLRRYR